MKFLAHISDDGKREQTVKNHLYSDKYDKLLVELICYAIITHHGLIDCIDTNANDK